MIRFSFGRKRYIIESLPGEVLKKLQPELKAREIAWSNAPLPEAYGDSSMIKVVFENLISNAIKFTRGKPKAEIEIGHLSE